MNCFHLSVVLYKSKDDCEGLMSLWWALCRHLYGASVISAKERSVESGLWRAFRGCDGCEWCGNGDERLFPALIRGGRLMVGMDVLICFPTLMCTFTFLRSEFDLLSWENKMVECRWMFQRFGGALVWMKASRARFERDVTLNRICNWVSFIVKKNTFQTKHFTKKLLNNKTIELFKTFCLLKTFLQWSHLGRSLPNWPLPLLGV